MNIGNSNSAKEHLPDNFDLWVDYGHIQDVTTSIQAMIPHLPPELTSPPEANLNQSANIKVLDLIDQPVATASINPIETTTPAPDARQDILDNIRATVEKEAA